MDYRYNLNSALSMIPNLQSGLGKSVNIFVYFFFHLNGLAYLCCILYYLVAHCKASLPLLFWGVVIIDINVYFNSIHGFEPTAELALFDLFNVDLVHGWVVDPEVSEIKIKYKKKRHSEKERRQ